MPSLNEIIADEEIVLVDSNVIEGHDHYSFYKDLYGTKDYSQVNNSMLSDKLANMKVSLPSILYDNVFTIKEVADELRIFAELLGKKLSYLSDAGTSKLTWMKSKGRIEPRKKLEARSNARNNMVELQKSVYEVSKFLQARDIYNEKKFRIDKRQSDILLAMVKTLTDTIGLKPKKIATYKNAQIDKSVTSDTDERLVAALFCLSMYSGRRAGFVTGDTDFVRLLGVLPRLMGADELMPCNNSFKEALEYNPFKFYLYKPESHEYELLIDSSKIQYETEFRINRHSGQESENMKQQIIKMWTELGIEEYKSKDVKQQVLEPLKQLSPETQSTSN
jgi:hypothetical protein